MIYSEVNQSKMASYKRRAKSGIVAYACNPRTWDIEEEDCCEFGDSLGYLVCSRSAWTLRRVGLLVLHYLRSPYTQTECLPTLLTLF